MAFLSDRGYKSTARGLSYTFEGTAAQLDTALIAGITHNLGALPSALELWAEVSAGKWEQHDPSTYVLSSTTQLEDTGTTVASGIGAVNVRLIAHAGAVALSIPEASASQAGIVGTGAQTFGGVKTFASDPTFTSGSQLVTGGAQTIGGAKTFTTASTTSNFIPANTGEFLIGNPTGTAGRISLSLRNQTAQPARLYSFVPSTDSAETNPALNFVAASTDGSSFSSITTERTRLFGFFNGNTAVTFVNADGTWNFINNVGIGTASPTNKMQIVGVNGAVTASAISGGLTISSAVGGNGLFSAGIGFSMQANQDQGRSGIVGYQDGTDVDVMGLKFLTHPGTLSSQDSIVAMTISPAGAVTLGPSSGTAVSHTVQGNSTDGTLRIKAGSFSGHIALQRETTSTGTVWLGSANGDFRIGTTAGGTDIGQATAAGAWTLGPSSGLNGFHTIQAASNNANEGALSVKNTNATNANPVARFETAASGDTVANKIINFLRGGFQSGAIVVNGTGAATFGTYSDSRLKTNIVPLSNELANILALNPVSFDMLDGAGSTIGFIAQEMETVYPDAVSYVGPETEEMKFIGGWDKTSARLVKAIQELHAELQSAKERIAQLEGTP